jgi:hypothetical protein
MWYNDSTTCNVIPCRYYYYFCDNVVRLVLIAHTQFHVIIHVDSNRGILIHANRDQKLSCLEITTFIPILLVLNSNEIFFFLPYRKIVNL